MRVDARLIAAIGAVWVLWGSTFAGMRFAVGTIPPFAMASIRFTVAGAILLAICRARGPIRVTRADVVRAAVTGATLLLLGNGMTAWSVQYLPTGINSLLLSVSPIWMALIAFLWYRERPNKIAIAGMLLGLLGLALLMRPTSATTIPFWPAVVAVLASVSWSFGSIFQRRMGHAGDVVLGSALQMIVGGLLLAVEAAAFGQWRAFDPHAISAASFGGLAWLIVFGSLFGYSAYLYTMQHATTALASTYAYVNPVVSMILGFVLFHEHLTPLEFAASAVIVVGVALMLVPARTPRPAPEP